MISFDEAVKIVCGIARPVGKEQVPLGHAHRRVLADAIIARVDSPPCDVSAMDGYAVRDADLEQLPASLPLIGESFAGAGCQTAIRPGTSIRIFTGAPVPPGADRVVVQEMVQREGGNAIISGQPGPARHIRPRGSDFRAGDPILEAGTLLGFRQMVAAAGADHADLSVWRGPKVVILGTGDELTAPGTAADQAGRIPESVSYGVAALAEEWGATIQEQLTLGDDLDAMTEVAGRSLDKADLVIVTGGASVGEKDFAKSMFEPHGLDLRFSKVSIKPGKPVWVGNSKGKLVVGLPGNPTSALVTARLFLAPLVAGMTGLRPEAALRWRKARLLSPLDPCGDRETFVRGKAVDDGVVPVSNQDSSAQKMLANADILIRRRAGALAAVAGETVSVLDF